MSDLWELQGQVELWEQVELWKQVELVEQWELREALPDIWPVVDVSPGFRFFLGLSKLILCFALPQHCKTYQAARKKRIAKYTGNAR